MATTPKPRDRSGPLRRLPGEDFSTAKAIFQAAMLLLTPDDQTQRKAFEALMPFMYVLRNNGCSWAQITKLLTDAGFVLQPSSVRTYYSEMLATRQEICQERMNEQILLLAEVRKETKGVNVADINSRVAAIMNQQKAQVASKLDAVFGPIPVASAPPVPALLPVATQKNPPPAAVAVPVSPTAREENKKTGLRPAPLNDPAGVPPAKQQQPEVATTNINLAPPSVSSTGTWTCSPLPEGIKSLGKREEVSKDMYLPGDLEHPAIPNVWLSLEQRLSPVALEFVNADDGEIRLETEREKRFRIKWKTPIPTTETRTSGSFTKMDMSLFKETPRTK